MRNSLLLFAFWGGLALCRDTATPPTFARDIAPIVYENCAVCHHPGGGGPFSLLTYSDVKRHARQIAAVTGSRYMPPFLPQTGYGSFADERRLADAQIQTISQWVQAGAPEGPSSETPAPPMYPSDWQLGTPDLVLQAAKPFTLPASGPDVFWNFVFRPDLKTRRYVRAIEIRPGNSRLVHHANLIVDRAGSAQRLAGKDDDGFPGMDLTISRNPLDPESHFLFWKPGSLPRSEPDGFSWRLDPGNLLVLNTHLQPSGKPEQVLPSVALYFTEKAPTKFPLLLQLEADDSLNIPPHARDITVHDDFRLPEDVDIIAIYPHAHYLGKLLEAYATLPGGARQWLIRIPQWDFNWQSVYLYRAPVFLPRGTVITMRFHYSNSSAKRVCAGNGATDEMSHLWLQVLPRSGGDRRSLQIALMQHRLDYLSARYNLALALMKAGQTEEALTHMQKVAAAYPTNARLQQQYADLLQLQKQKPDK
ncbi:MAG: hypothetical protein JO028_14920 [Acidobacteriaceae bacterium]|nr:hypothetical protein [Acidobacteriaceae bacterium]